MADRALDVLVVLCVIRRTCDFGEGEGDRTVVNWKIWAGLFGAAALFYGGYQYAAALYGADIAALREDYASRALQLEEQYREKERSQAEAISAAWEARDKARADAVDVSADLERVRREFSAYKRRVPAAGTGSEPASREPCRGGAELVSRCSELAARCVGLAQELSADRDAVKEITKTPVE